MTALEKHSAAGSSMPRRKIKIHFHRIHIAGKRSPELFILARHDQFFLK